MARQEQFKLQYWGLLNMSGKASQIITFPFKKMGES
jgi:hypothetical protein